MQTGLVHLHNLLRWIILVLLLLSTVKSYVGWKNNKAFTNADKKIWLFTLIAAHTTLLIGTYQWLLGRYGILTTMLPEGVSVMKDAFYRFYWIEHPVAMIAAITCITAAYAQAKKPIADSAKFKKAFYFFVAALVLLLAAIPWPFRDIIGRTLVPGM